MPPNRFGRAEQRREILSHLLIFARRRPLERKDRLLLVADREQGAGEKAARPRAGRKFRHQVAHDPPLLLARILRLVDQDVVEPEIELVMHPARIDLRQHLAGLVDEVIVIEEPAAVLLGAIVFDHLARDGDERRRAVAADDGLAARDQDFDARLLGEESIRQNGTFPCQGLGDQRLARPVALGEEDAEILVHLQPGGGRESFDEARGLIFVVRAAALEHGGDGGPFR